MAMDATMYPEKIRGIKISEITKDGTGYCALFIRDDVRGLAER